MKKFRRMIAFVIAMVMVLSMGMSAYAAPEGEASTPKGSITVSSPIVGAKYSVYQIFDMTTNEAEDAFSYTITDEHPFFTAVKNYASNKDHGLILTKIEGSDPAVYNVSAMTEEKDGYKIFDAQAFGKAMQAALTDSITPVAEKTATTDPDTSAELKFEDLPLGYFLINPAYPAATAVTVTMGKGTPEEVEFTNDDLVKDGEGKVKEPRELTDDAKGKIETYVTATVDVDKYIADNGITTNKDGSPLDDAGKAVYEAELIDKMKADAEEKILAAFNNNGSEADINVKEPILVFLDSSKPDATIIEKNETDKWDIPVNPDGDTEPGTPDHGEPEGGKNIIVQEATDEKPAYSADWSEAAVGDSVHYQLRVNAMNFIRTGDTDDTIQQVKEYFLADFQSGHMLFDKSQGLHVSVWQGDNDNDSQKKPTNVTKDKDGTVVTDGYLDYSDKEGVFFKNTTGEDADSKPDDIFGDDGTGIMVPWVKVVEDPSEEELEKLVEEFPVYTITKVPTEGFETEDAKLDSKGNKIPVKEVVDGEWTEVPDQYVSVNNHVVNGQGQVLDKDGNPIGKTKPVYTFSLYSSDVTIVVDYWMILEDDAIVDEPGNKNYAQYAWSPVDNKDGEGNPKTPTPPSDEDKPSQKEEVDEATVYTFALAWVKIDNQGKELAGAEFELPFFVKEEKDGDAYVFGGDKKGEGLTNKVTTTDASAVITIKGVPQGTYSIKETKAPDGYNQLTEPFEIEAKKSGPEVTTKTKTIIYLDRDGNVTETVTTATVEYNTDKDSNVDNVPVYQFNPVINNKGTELPSTGGVGTTMFYVIGAMLVMVAGVLLVTRRRMNVN